MVFTRTLTKYGNKANIEGKQPYIAQWWDGMPGVRVWGDHTMGGEVNTEHKSIYVYITIRFLFQNHWPKVGPFPEFSLDQKQI